MARPSMLRQRAEAYRRRGEKILTASAGSAAYRQGAKPDQKVDRNQIAQPWQIELYRHMNICGEARYAATLFANLASRAELGVAEAQSLSNRAVWVKKGDEVDALAALAPTQRERSKILRDYMLHRTIAGECYLVARPRISTDPEPNDPEPLWEIVAVTELRRMGGYYEVRVGSNNHYVPLVEGEHPVIRLWDPDPQNRSEPWSPMRSLLPTLNEIEYFTKHIYTQVRTRLMSAGVWFVPDNLTYPDPPVEAVQGGAETIAQFNDAERFMATLVAAGSEQLGEDEPAFPVVVMADAEALKMIDQSKLIQFWSEIDDKAMVLRSDAVRRFALGMDMPPEQILGSSGLAVTGAGGSAGSVNHWGVWANEEQTISAHIEPALETFCGQLTAHYLRTVVPGTEHVLAFDTAKLRLRQDRSKEAMEWYDRGVLKAATALRETGFDPEADVMDDKEFRRWLLVKIAGGSATPEQVQESLRLLGVVLNVDLNGGSEPATSQPGRNLPPSLKEHPYEGPPRVDHEHNDAAYSANGIKW